MEDYPRNRVEFDERFASVEACIAYLISLRWPRGFACPKCGGERAWRRARLAMVCARCRHETSITAGTLFEKTHKPLSVWFKAMWAVTRQKTGASALGLQRVLGLGSYETAWLWLHKLRPAMVRPGRDRLKGSVEVDETYVGGPEEGSRGRQTEEKSIVAVAAEEVGDGIGRIRLGRIPDVSAPSRSTFIEQGIVEGSMIHTDDWLGYQGVEEKGYGHKVSHIKRSGDRPHELMPRVHRVSSLMKRWLLGTHQGSVSPKHLDYYLDEFTFRFNRRTSTHRGKLFFRLMEQAATIGPTTYLDIVGRRDPTWTRWG